MKCSKKVVAFVLATTMIFGSTIGVFAEEPSKDSVDWDATDNKITFTAGGGTETTDPLDPEKPGEEVTEDLDGKEVVTGNTGDLRIDVVPQFDFGTNSITTGSKSFYAELPEIGDTEVAIPYYVQVTDVRGSGAGWVLNAKMTSAFSDGTHELSGATIDLKNITAVSQEGTERPTTIGGTATDRLEFTESGKTIMIATAEAGQGMGVSIVRFGDTARYSGTMTADKSVVLEIPETTQVYAADYSATIKWTLGAVPTTP